MKMYATYGVIAHEYQPLFTLDAPAGNAYDVFDLTLPEGWSFAENGASETLIVSPDGTTYLPREILTNWGDEPAFVWFDGHSDRRIILTDYVKKEAI